MTSFINHMMQHDPDLLSLGEESIEIIFQKEYEPYDGHEKFPYKEFRDMIGDEKFPSKTKSSLQYLCTYNMKNWRLTNCELSLTDFPGERFVDLAMIDKSYAEWSDWILTILFKDKSYQKFAAEYKSIVEKPDAVEDEIVLSYRLLLKTLFKNYCPFITPSSFLLDRSGYYSGVQIFNDDIIENSIVGTSKETQFTPLPKELRDFNKNLTHQFETRYKKYRDEVAYPVCRTLSRCNELVVLVDVTTILASGAGSYKATQEIMKQVFESLQPGLGLYGVVEDFYKKLFLGHISQKAITKIAIVATKADKVWQSPDNKSQINNVLGLLKALLKDTLKTVEYNAMKLEIKHFACAAVKCTNPIEDGKLVAKLKTKEDGSYYEYSTSKVPEKWPTHWHEGEFGFPDVKPVFPDNGSPPDHIGLEDVMKFLLLP